MDRQQYSSGKLAAEMEMATVLDTLISKVNLALKLEDSDAVPMRAEDLAIYDDSISPSLLYSEGVTGSLADQCRSFCKSSVCQVYLLQKIDLQRKPSSVLDFVRAKARWAKQGCASRAPAAAAAAAPPKRYRDGWALYFGTGLRPDKKRRAGLANKTIEGPEWTALSLEARVDFCAEYEQYLEPVRGSPLTPAPAPASHPCTCPSPLTPHPCLCPCPCPCPPSPSPSPS